MQDSEPLHIQGCGIYKAFFFFFFLGRAKFNLGFFFGGGWFLFLFFFSQWQIQRSRTVAGAQRLTGKAAGSPHQRERSTGKWRSSATPSRVVLFLFGPFSKPQTNSIEPSLTPSAWISIHVSSFLPPFFFSFLEQILSAPYVPGTFWLLKTQQQTKQTMFWCLHSKRKKWGRVSK